MADPSKFFDDRVTVTVTTTTEGAAEVLKGLEHTAEDMPDSDKTWVTVAPVEKPDMHIVSTPTDPAHPNEESWV